MKQIFFEFSSFWGTIRDFEGSESFVALLLYESTKHFKVQMLHE